MAGRIRQLIDELGTLRTHGQPGLQHFLRAHLMLNGINPDHYTAKSQDDPATIRQLEKMIHDFQETSKEQRP